MKNKIKALSEHLEIDIDEAEELIENDSYLVLTDDEADETAKEYIEQILWAFNADFLADMTDLPSEVFEAMRGKCEDSNDTVEKLIKRSCGIDDFVETAISIDGRGHFMSSYDGEESEQNGLFIYRIN